MYQQVPNCAEENDNKKPYSYISNKVRYSKKFNQNQDLQQKYHDFQHLLEVRKNQIKKEHKIKMNQKKLKGEEYTESDAYFDKYRSQSLNKSFEFYDHEDPLTEEQIASMRKKSYIFRKRTHLITAVNYMNKKARDNNTHHLSSYSYQRKSINKPPNFENQLSQQQKDIQKNKDQNDNKDKQQSSIQPRISVNQSNLQNSVEKHISDFVPVFEDPQNTSEKLNYRRKSCHCDECGEMTRKEKWTCDLILDIQGANTRKKKLEKAQRMSKNFKIMGKYVGDKQHEVRMNQFKKGIVIKFINEALEELAEKKRRHEQNLFNIVKSKMIVIKREEKKNQVQKMKNQKGHKSMNKKIIQHIQKQKKKQYINKSVKKYCEQKNNVIELTRAQYRQEQNQDTFFQSSFNQMRIVELKDLVDQQEEERSKIENDDMKFFFDTGKFDQKGIKEYLRKQQEQQEQREHQLFQQKKEYYEQNNPQHNSLLKGLIYSNSNIFGNSKSHSSNNNNINIINQNDNSHSNIDKDQLSQNGNNNSNIMNQNQLNQINNNNNNNTNNNYLSVSPNKNLGNTPRKIFKEIIVQSLQQQTSSQKKQQSHSQNSTLMSWVSRTKINNHSEQIPLQQQNLFSTGGVQDNRKSFTSQFLNRKIQNRDKSVDLNSTKSNNSLLTTNFNNNNNQQNTIANHFDYCNSIEESKQIYNISSFKDHKPLRTQTPHSKTPNNNMHRKSHLIENQYKLKRIPTTKFSLPTLTQEKLNNRNTVNKIIRPNDIQDNINHDLKTMNQKMLLEQQQEDDQQQLYQSSSPTRQNRGSLFQSQTDLNKQTSLENPEQSESQKTIQKRFSRIKNIQRTYLNTNQPRDFKKKDNNNNNETPIQAKSTTVLDGIQETNMENYDSLYQKNKGQSAQGKRSNKTFTSNHNNSQQERSTSNLYAGQQKRNSVKNLNGYQRNIHSNPLTNMQASIRLYQLKNTSSPSKNSQNQQNGMFSSRNNQNSSMQSTEQYYSNAKTTTEDYSIAKKRQSIKKPYTGRQSLSKDKLKKSIDMNMNQMNSSLSSGNQSALKKQRYQKTDRY